MKLFKRKDKDPKAGLRDALQGGEAPSFPQVTMKILQRLRDPESSMSEIGEALQWDPGLVVRMLATVNSAAFAPRQTIQDVAHAASYLGRAHVEQIVLAIAVKDTLPRAARPGFESGRFWETAAYRAVLARLLSTRLEPDRAGACFTIGLLQDMAVPVLVHARTDEYAPVLLTWHAEPEARLESLERDTFGWCHGEVGAMLGSCWELPDDLVTSIGSHHFEDGAEGDVPVAVRLVSLLRETAAEYGIEALVETSDSGYGLEKDWVASIVEDAGEQARELASTLA